MKAYKSGLENNQEDSSELNQLPDLVEYLSLAADVLLLYSEISPLNFNQLRIQENIDLPIQSEDPDLLFKLAQLTFQIYNPEPGQVHTHTIPSFIIVFVRNFIFKNHHFRTNSRS